MKDVQPHDAILIVDVQNDFFPGGPLPAPNGEKILSGVNKMIEVAQANNIPIFADRDWHPIDNISFIDQGGPYKPHCVQNTKGAEFHPDMKLPEDYILVSKGFESNAHPYSPFDGVLNDSTPLPDAIKKMGVKRLWIGGLLLDYCVEAAALDSARHGLETFVVMDATELLYPEAKDLVISKLTGAGVKIV